VKLRVATPQDAQWINERYAEVRFLPSDLATDIVVNAEVDDERAGLGRLVGSELGGILVLERFRGRGISRAIIDELLKHAGGRTVYCIPFAELESLYASAGFTRTNEAPPAVLEKFAWCQRTYDKPVLLMTTTGKTPDALP
jgi:GNAT superfamily N-acetyltransferase